MPQHSDGTNECERIEPVVNTASPQHDLVIGSNARNHALDRRRGPDRQFVVDAERCHPDQRAQRRIAVVRQWVGAAQCSEVTQPEVPLLLAGTHEEVPTRQLLVEDGNNAGNDSNPNMGFGASAVFELLEVEGIVDINNKNLLRAAQKWIPVHQHALEHEHVAPLFSTPNVG